MISSEDRLNRKVWMVYIKKEKSHFLMNSLYIIVYIMEKVIFFLFFLLLLYILQTV